MEYDFEKQLAGKRQMFTAISVVGAVASQREGCRLDPFSLFSLEVFQRHTFEENRGSKRPFVFSSGTVKLSLPSGEVWQMNQRIQMSIEETTRAAGGRGKKVLSFGQMTDDCAKAR